MKKILVVDLPGEEIGTISACLSENGYTVVEAENILRAAAVLDETRFDLILCSQTLFFTDKSPLKSIILEDTRHSKIIILQEAGETLPILEQNSRIIGVVQKPVDLKKLLDVVSIKLHQTGFSGIVNDIDLTDYLQLLAMNKATKGFIVEGESGDGILVFYLGVLIYAAYGNLHGELAFHAIASLQNGRIVDKGIKRMPKPNINKSLSQLLLEFSMSRDEADVDNGEKEENFLFDEIRLDEKEEVPEEMLPVSGEILQVAKEKSMQRSPLFMGVTLLLFVGLIGGLGWHFFPSFQKTSKKTALQIQKQTQINAQNPAQNSNAGLPSNVALKVDSTPVPSPGAPQRGLGFDPNAVNGKLNLKSPLRTEAHLEEKNLEKRKTVAQKTTLSQPEIILRLHGSNTIGAKLAENLVIAYLVQEYKGKDISVRTGDSPVEKTVTCHTNNGLLGIEIHAHGSSTGFKDLQAGMCDIGMASRKIKEKEVTALADLGDMTDSASEHVLALDGIAVIVHKNNPLRSLSMETIAAIFTGEITKWEEVTDGKLTGTIHVYARDSNSGTFDTFKSIVLKKKPLLSTAKRFESNADLSDDVAEDRQGIGFTGLPYIRRSKALSVSDQGTIAIFPNFFTVSTEDYPLARRLYLYLPQKTENNIAIDFVDFCLGTPGQMVVANAGFIDLDIRPFVAGINVEAQSIQNKVVFQHYVEETKDKKRLSLNFRFHPNSIELDNRALRDLDRMVDFLKKKSIESVTLIGFADSKGEYQYNTSLAMERSKVVQNALNSRGVPVTAVISASEEMPVASNITHRGRQKNRRVEIWVRLNRNS